MKQKIYLSAALGAIFTSAILLFTRYIDSLYRVGMALTNLLGSLGYYFQKILLGRIPTVVPTVNTIPNVDLQKFLPFDLKELIRKYYMGGTAILNAAVQGVSWRYHFTHRKR